jgi:pyridoxal phosphate enzyme (YggS family)
MDTAHRIAENLHQVQARIAAAAARSGRQSSAIRLVGVTKYVGAEETQALVAAGCLDLGESRPQELWRKATELSDQPVRWHMIGHLQRNKLARTLPLVSLIHSGDSLRLLEAIHADIISRSAAPSPVLLEVNVSGDAAKHGFAPTELEPLGEALAALSGVEPRGLMCMAGREASVDETRREFARLRALRDRLQTAWGERCRLDELSMGMSGDYEAAIEEGATLVRIGSALFEGLEP